MTATANTLKYGNYVTLFDGATIDDEVVRKALLFNYADSAARLLIEQDVSVGPPTLAMIDGKPAWRADGAKNPPDLDGIVLRNIVARHYQSLPVQES